MVLKRWRRDRDGGLPGGRGIPPAPTPPGEERPARRRREEPELVELVVGFDRFEASALVARLEASDIPVRLLTMDDHGLVVGMVARHPHRILIKADDEERVRAIIERTAS
ncbi:MAG TPA: DUF2007 domain-containing protein [Acidimicrobiales bacterium]|nr:DUF2007 domain-containing protein [Acidimicrobiales bacterium]